jgi:hypothetical protein
VKSTRMCKRYKTTQDYLSAVLKDVFIVAEWTLHFAGPNKDFGP